MFPVKKKACRALSFGLTSHILVDQNNDKAAKTTPIRIELVPFVNKFVFQQTNIVSAVVSESVVYFSTFSIPQ